MERQRSKTKGQAEAKAKDGDKKGEGGTGQAAKVEYAMVVDKQAGAETLRACKQSLNTVAVFGKLRTGKSWSCDHVGMRC